jgi:hypothetical protein
MSATRKPRSDAKLKTLSPQRQEHIAEYARDHKLEDVKAWLAEDGVKTSVGALSEFLSWWALKQQLTRNESTVESVLEQLKTFRPDLTEGQLFAAGQAFFSAMAIEQRDAKTWKRTQDLKFKRELMDLELEKFRRETCEMFIDWYANKQASEIAAGGASRSEKIDRLYQLMFGEERKTD